MAGGRGTRFWPLSRSARPKQLLALGSARSLLRDTFERVAPLVGPDRLIVITNHNLVPAVASELPELPAKHIIGEPAGRNTAPCAALGVGIAELLHGPGPVALLPADHWIPDGDLFRRQLQDAFAHATSTGEAVCFGISPSHPETGFGYLEVAVADGEGPLPGKRFVEKPDLPTAESYLAGGRHFWNSGIFVWDSRAFAAALAAHLPSLAGHLAVPVAEFGGPGFADALAGAYAECDSVSIDVGVMEQLPAFSVFKAAFGWSDLGSWDAWGSLAPALAADNRGRAEILTVDSQRNVIFAPGKLVALVGIADTVVVDTPDALLVCRADQAQRIRELITQLEGGKRQDLL